MAEAKELLSSTKTMTGRNAVISGSSAGIGATIAAELSSRGANIVLNYPWESLRKECENVGQQLHTPWIAVCADLSTTDGPQILVSAAVERFGHIDILVNNAGIVPLAPLWKADVASWNQAMNLNARGCFLLTQAALPHLTPYTPSDKASGNLNGSRIICVGSAASRAPEHDQGTYAATKGAIDAMLRIWARELPPKYGCTVNGVGPGPVAGKSFYDKLGDNFDFIKGIFEAGTPCEGAFADPTDVAWTVAFLAEARSKWINGDGVEVKWSADSWTDLRAERYLDTIHDVSGGIAMM
ncbi:uncharacterized protein N0V89_004970 [Didymosphaeria variabile]|uniref:NAD(P)-binding protein n=1 Tax=Didymosphaeria variabile TaxID=1932322 RepID=A0A9W9CBB3_9PLEO|nr:uncharacterized protein N0V89_004970 [Didymosphaeria variabile]KAJ4353243.1 hypothetical protein N0V89_004970 [Didymosphaeria variabile]